MNSKFRLHYFKAYTPFIKYLIIGFLFTTVIHSVTSCKKESSPTESIPPVSVDVTKIEDAAKITETAFTSGDVQQINNILTDDAKEQFKGELSSLSKDVLVAIGNAIKSRKLDSYGEMYAEYTFQKDGQTYTLSFSRADESTWKLMRF